MSWIDCLCGGLAYPKSKVQCSSVVAVSVLTGRRNRMVVEAINVHQS